MADDKIKTKIEGEEKFEQPVEKDWEGSQADVERLKQEMQGEKPEQAIESETIGEKPKLPEGEAGVSAAAPAPTVVQDDQRLKVVEGIMSEGLKEIYIKLPPDKKREFKLVGEETAKQINELLKQAKVKANKILDLIKKWLSILPGVNRFFLEQEAKIKTDELIKLKEKHNFDYKQE